MPLATLLLPAALLAAAAAATGALGLAGIDVGRQLASAAAWLGLGFGLAAWLAGSRAPVEIAGAAAVAVTSLDLQLGPVTVLFTIVILVPVALLLTFQPRSWAAAATAALTAAVALVTLAAGSLVLTGLGLSACAGLVLLMLRQESTARTTHYWLALTGAWLLLLWAGVVLRVTGGTSSYAAVPVSALGTPVFGLLALASVLCAGLWPWRTWVSEAWARPRLEAGTLAVALLVPLGIYPLVRAYALGAGQWPTGPAGPVLATLGAAAALGAGVRAQAASTPRGFLAEMVPLGAGVVLLSLSLGTPLGLVAALTGLAGIGAVAGLAPLVPDNRGPLTLVALLVCAGAPPAIVFGGWLLAVQAALEAGAAPAFLGLAAAGAWLLALAAAARAARLPAEPADSAGRGSPAGAAAAVAVALASGVGLTALVALLAIPAAALVMSGSGARATLAGLAPAAILSPGSLGVSTASGGWATVLLAGPLVVAGLAVALAARALRRRGRGPAPAKSNVLVLEPAPEPIFRPPLAGLPERCLRVAAEFRLPAQYRSLLRPGALERAVVEGRPWFWVAVTVGLAFVVTR
ncbi:MAG TPA: hypothetical protein VKF59_04715 [Candidatus Dormibacteraeota bacterium]|nr:hypothetical protein [Candidatus Dormibacteraeota bacterium]